MNRLIHNFFTSRAAAWSLDGSRPPSIIFLLGTFYAHFLNFHHPNQFQNQFKPGFKTSLKKPVFFTKLLFLLWLVYVKQSFTCLNKNLSMSSCTWENINRKRRVVYPTWFRLDDDWNVFSVNLNSESRILQLWLNLIFSFFKMLAYAIVFFGSGDSEKTADFSWIFLYHALTQVQRKHV